MINKNIEIVGIASQNEIDEKNNQFYTQFMEQYNLCIPRRIFYRKDLTQIYINSKICDFRLVESIESTDNIMVAGISDIKLLYTSKYKKNSVVSVNFKIPFFNFIVIPRDSNICEVSPFIVDVGPYKVNNRKLILTINFIIIADLNNTCENNNLNNEGCEEDFKYISYHSDYYLPVCSENKCGTRYW